MKKKFHRKNQVYGKVILISLVILCLLGIVVSGVFFLSKNKKKKNQAIEKQTEMQSQVTTESEMPSELETENKPEAETNSEIEIESETETEFQTEAETENETQTDAAATQADGPLIVIDPGHQGPGQDMSGYEEIAPGSSETKPRIVTGTQGQTTGLYEYELNLDISLLLQEELLSRGYQVIMTRTIHDINIGNIERTQIANDAGADAVVRIHANGSEDTSVNGALTMAPSAANPYVGFMYNECNSLARCVIDAYCEATGLRNAGILEVDYMTGINWCQVPVTIVEMGFMTNPGDDVYMADSNNHNIMVMGIANGIDGYFGR